MSATPTPPPANRPLSPRRRTILEAAVSVVAAHGLRGLTHRAVDREAGLPEGSTSGYFRTRHALQSALGEFVVARLADDVEEFHAQISDWPPTDERTVALLTALFLRWLEERELLLNRLELGLQAARDPATASLLLNARARMVQVIQTIVCAHDPAATSVEAEVLLASLDGVLMSGLIRPEAERAAFVERSLHLLTEHLRAPGA